MNIVQLTPGAGPMYCGNCFRDNSLVAALRGMGHEALMVPLYLPLTLDEVDQSAGTPVFFGGVSVFLEQKSSLFRHAPAWLHHLLASRPLLRWAAGKAARTRPDQAGELTLSMLAGEDGKQARELEALIAWLKTQPKPDVVCLSNALLVGSARRLRQELNAPVTCMFQGEDSFLDGLPDSHRRAGWQALRQRAGDVDLFIAPSRYFGDLMSGRLGLSAERVRIVPNGITLDGFAGDSGAAKLAPPGEGRTSDTQSSPVLGFFARMCREKGLDTLVDAFIELNRRETIPGLRLRVGGSCGPSDQKVVAEMRERLAAKSLLDRVEFCPNLSRTEKLAFLRSLSVFSVPAKYGEAFGLYILEALAAGVPVVQPRTAAFPELLEMTGGGVLCEPGDPESLADALEALLLDPDRVRTLGETGRRAVFERFSARAMAQGMLKAWRDLAREPQPASVA